MAYQRLLKWILGLVLGMSFAYASGEAAVAQTVLSPCAAIEGEDPEILKMLYESWAKRPKAAKVRGTVVNASGMPTPEAKLFVVADFGVRLEGHADREGRFEFEITDSRPFPIYAEALDGAMAGISDSSVEVSEGVCETKITLFPTRDVTFKVVNANGDKVSGAACGAFVGQAVVARGRSGERGEVTLRVPDMPFDYAMRPRADEPADTRGMFSAGSRLDTKRVLAFYAFSDEHGLGAAGRQIHLEDAEYPSEIRVSKPEPAKVKVVDREGKPMSAAPVMLMGPQVTVRYTIGARSGGMIGGVDGEVAGFGGTATIQAPFFGDPRVMVRTNAAGEAVVRWHARVQPENEGRRTPLGAAGADARSPMGVMAMHDSWPRAFGQVEKIGDAFTARLSLYGPAKINGKVTTPNGEVAEGVRLRWRNGADAGAQQDFTTNDRGEFEVTATVEDGDLFVEDERWVVERIHVADLVRKSATNHLDVKLREGKRVTIKVTSGPEYLPLAGHGVMIRGGRSGEVSLKTNEAGEIQAMLDRGLYVVTANSPAASSGLIVEPTKLLVKDQAKIEVTIHLAIATPRTIAVTVKKADGKTLARGAKIQMLTPETPLNRSAAAQRAATQGRGGRPVDEAGRFAGGGRGGGGFGAAQGRGVAGPGGAAVRSAAAKELVTDEKGNASVKTQVASEPWLLVSGEGEELALAKIDVLSDSLEVVLKPSVSVKGKLLDEATGEPIVGVTVSCSLSPAILRQATSPPSGFGGGRVASSPATGTQAEALTNAAGEFEFKGLIANSPYTLSMDLPRGEPGADLFERAAAGWGGRRTPLRSITSPAKETLDLGEVKTAKPAPPPRQRIENDPNAQ